jgi:hypothetical protein
VRAHRVVLPPPVFDEDPGIDPVLELLLELAEASHVDRFERPEALAPGVDRLVAQSVLLRDFVHGAAEAIFSGISWSGNRQAGHPGHERIEGDRQKKS